MKNKQLKGQVFPNRTDPRRPVFSWMKTALVGDNFIIWSLYYGNALDKGTLCHRVFRPKNEPLDHRQRVGLSWSLRLSKQQLRREWRERYPQVNAYLIPAPTMSNHHRATPEQWAYMHERTEAGLEMTSCILELRARVEALEAGANDRQQDEDAESAAESDPAPSLVNQVAWTIATFASEGLPGDDATPTARAVIRNVAAWLREFDPEPGPIGRLLGQVLTPYSAMADELEHQSNR
jgi:hypothetical protein